MLKILVNAYALSPHTGSEPGMAWNWCLHLANHCELHIITEGEFKAYIEKALLTLPQRNNMHFYYNPVSEKVRTMCWNQGDWRFYKHYKKWQYKTYKIALHICSEHKIDILHQLNMIGFREPGYLWKINNIPFVWGPIGGLKQFPTNYLSEANLKTQLFVRLKNIITINQLKYDPRVNKALESASLLISSIPDSYNAIKKYKGLESIIIPETGCFPSKENSIHRFSGTKFEILWVGKFDFRKQLPLALKSIAASNNQNINLHIYGSGTEKQELKLKELTHSLGIEKQIIWHGDQPHNVVLEAMRNAHLFLFTSVSEDTSTVVLEALSSKLPVLCFDTCGMSVVIDNNVGRKISLTTPNQSIEQFAKQLNDFYKNKKLLRTLSTNCEKRQNELSWTKKAMNVYYLLEKL
jgi:glycosyltransferase involved in cell wall biosynthesis